MANTWEKLFFEKLRSAISPEWLKVLMSANEGVNAVQEYESDFDCACAMYEEKYGRDDLYFIIIMSLKLKINYTSILR